MAKSLRSKWKRKMRAVKRERYGVKELAKLKMIVETTKNASSNNEDTSMDIVKGMPFNILPTRSDTVYFDMYHYFLWEQPSHARILSKITQCKNNV